MMGLIIGTRTKLREKKQEVKTIEFNPYDRLQLLKPIDVAIINKDYSRGSDIINDRKFSVVLPVKNEEKTIAKLLNSIKNQSLKPDEIIIIDGDSEDKTVNIIKNYADENNDLSINLIEPDGGTLSKHRNIGIQEAKNEWIILTDAGTVLNENVYLNLIGSITDYSDADLVCGIYFPIKKSYWSSKFVWDWDDMDYTAYLPSTRVMGIKRSIALTIGGFPEYLTFTGDDTLFDINYRKISTKWVINKSAYAFWGSAKDRRKALRRAYLYGKGDGESGVGDSRFYEYLIYRTENIKNEIPDDVTRAFFEGYLEGREDRVSILAERKGVQGNILILSGVPLTDTGGGARGTQMVLEFTKKNYKVTFCNVYHSFETPDKIFLDIDIPLIELYYLNNFSIEEYIERHRMIIDKTILILEFPHPDFIQIINKLKEVEPNIQIIYDCIDNWDSDLGWIWYTKEKEIEIIEMSDIIIASANTLVDRLKNLTNKEVQLIPNAVNLRIFDRNIKHSKPKDLPDDEKPIAIYIGALWGTWFDWELVKYVAAYAPDFNFIFIGNIPDDNSYIQELVTYPNVFFLGLKPQYLLPHYLKHSDVCIIPFKYDEKIIKYTNPLKIYEYLAMGKPVVSTYMDELISMPQILLSKNYNEFAENIQESLKITIDYPVLEKYIHQNSIEKRVEDLLKIVKSARETKGKNQRWG